MCGYDRFAPGLTAVILAFFSSTTSFAFDIGLESPREWQGNGARVQWYPLDYGSQTVEAIDLKYQKNATTRAYYQSDDERGYIDGWGQSAYKDLKGAVSASGYGDRLWQAGGYYRDEIFFTTKNGQPADLAITFNVYATGYTLAEMDDAKAFLSIGWGYYGSVINPHTLGQQMLIDLSGADQYREFDGTVTMHSGESTFSNDGDGYLIKSGTYVPYSVGVWGTVNNGALDWAHTVGFVGFTVFQEGRQLASDEFTIVENVGAIPEPESYAMLIAGLGLLGLVARRRKLRAALLLG